MKDITITDAVHNIIASSFIDLYRYGFASHAFDWDDPNGAANGTDKLTAVADQSDRAGKRGFILGYQRCGALSFQVCNEDDWLAIWSNGDNNEPHAPMYCNGMYHLFFQENMTVPYWRLIYWGHLVSPDMVNWKPVREAITSTEDFVVPNGVWTGSSTLDKNGVPLLFFTAGNDNYSKVEGLISNQNRRRYASPSFGTSLLGYCLSPAIHSSGPFSAA